MRINWKYFYSMKFKTCFIFRASILATLMLLCSGCLPILKDEVAKPKIAFGKFLRATVYLQEAGYTIRLCGASSVDLLFDPAQLLTKHFLQGQQQIPSLYVELDASVAKSFDWEVKKLYFISKKPQACGANLQSKDYLVKAKNGQWQADVIKHKVILSKPDIYSQLTFNSKSYLNNQWSAKLQLAQDKGYKMTLDITDQECVDDFEQWYSLSAIMLLNSEQFTGCARKGDSTNSFVSGKYTNPLAVDNAFIVLNLEQTNKASLIIDYRNGHPMIVSNGNWKMRSNQVLELNLFSATPEAEQSVMLFQVYNNHELSLKGFSEQLGKAGLKLLPIK